MKSIFKSLVLSFIMLLAFSGCKEDKDELVGTGVKTLDAKDVTGSGALLCGLINAPDPVAMDFEFGFEISTDPGFTTESTSKVRSQYYNENHEFSYQLEHLMHASTYYYRAYMINQMMLYHGQVKTFTTGMRNPCPDGAVDLGLSVYWSTCNLSESGLVNSPEVYGDYFAWGETSSKLNVPYEWSSYKWCNGSSTSLTKYSTSSSYGTVDNKTTLYPEDDVAHVILGGSWRMPTDAEWTELREKCSWTWTSNYNGTGVAGKIVTSNVEGYKDKSIFLPAAGRRYGTFLGGAGSEGYYWSSSLHTSCPYYAWSVYFDFYFHYVSGYDSERFYGISVRPVSE